MIFKSPTHLLAFFYDVINFTYIDTLKFKKNKLDNDLYFIYEKKDFFFLAL